jgi:hypothetical protein
VKATQRTSLAKRLPGLVQRYVPKKIKDLGKDYLPLRVKKVLDWQNFTLSEVLPQMKSRGVCYDEAEARRVIALIEDFHKYFAIIFLVAEVIELQWKLEVCCLQ